MTDKTYLEEFLDGVTDDLSKRLVDTFTSGHRDPEVKPTDLVLRLKEEMEAALPRSPNASD